MKRYFLKRISASMCVLKIGIVFFQFKHVILIRFQIRIKKNRGLVILLLRVCKVTCLELFKIDFDIPFFSKGGQLCLKLMSGRRA